MGSATSETVNFASDYKVRRSRNAAGESIQHVRIDVGSGSSESVVTTALPVTGTFTLPTGSATEAKQDTGNTSLDSIDGKITTGNASLASISGLAVPTHDYIALTYTGDNLTGVVYKTGGSSGSTVATLTLAYTGAQLDSVTKS